MKNFIARLIISTSLALFGINSALAEFNIQTNDVEPITKASAKDWIYLVTHTVNPSPLIGKSSVYAVNATGEDLQNVTCRGYYLVGPKPYITNNDTTNAPVSLPKWSVTLVPTKGFNTYCTNGVDAQGTTDLYHGSLNSADKSFDAATFVIFKK